MFIKPPTATAFISHSSSDAAKAMLVKEVLERQQIEATIFTTDVKAGLWRDQLIREIEESDFFVVLLTSSYHTSGHTDHEFGVALKSNTKIVVVLESDTTLYGLIEQYQVSIKCEEIDEDSAKKLAGVILEQSGLETKHLDYLL